MSFTQRAKLGIPTRKTAWEKIVEDLPKPEREALTSMVLDPAWSVARIVDACREEGLATSKDTITSWRKKLIRERAEGEQ